MHKFACFYISYMEEEMNMDFLQTRFMAPAGTVSGAVVGGMIASPAGIVTGAKLGACVGRSNRARRQSRQGRR